MTMNSQYDTLKSELPMCHVSKAIFCLALFMVLAEIIDYGGTCFPLVFLSFNSCASVRDLVLSSHSRPLWFLKSVKSFSTKPSTQMWPLSFLMLLVCSQMTAKGVPLPRRLLLRFRTHFSAPEMGQAQKLSGLWGRLTKRKEDTSMTGEKLSSSFQSWRHVPRKPARNRRKCLLVAVHCGCARQLQIFM